MRAVPPWKTIGILIMVAGFLLALLTPFARGFAYAIPISGGILLLLGGLIYLNSIGFLGGSKRRAIQTTHNCRIMGRYGFDDLNQMAFDDSNLDLDDPDTRLYVRVMMSNGVSREFATVRPLWEQCGEGMWGTITTQAENLIGFQRTTEPRG